MNKLTIDEFWKLKHQIDDEIKRLGWTKEKAKGHIKTVYGKSSRLSMSDEELFDLLNYLRSFCSTKSIPSVSTPLRRRRKRRGI